MSGAVPDISEADLVAYADGRLDTARLAEVEAWLAERPEEQRRLEGWREQTRLLRAVLDPVAGEAVPPELTALISRQPSLWQRWRVPALAAALALAIGLGGGWQLGRSGWPFAADGQDFGEVVARAGYAAHRLYTAEVRHPVEVGAGEEDHLVSWLSKRLDSPLKAPDLQAQGLNLLGGRLIPVDGRPAAQLMYEGASGDRFTLFAMRTEGGGRTSLHFEDWGKVGCFYWTDGVIAYSVTGPADRARLMDIARAVYEQVS